MLFFSTITAICAADPLPNTKPLTDDGDLARKMVDGVHAYLDHELIASIAERKKMWSLDRTTAKSFLASVQPHRERLQKILGVVDSRLPPKLEYVGGPDDPALIAETKDYKVFNVRWRVLPGVDAEGLLLEPKGKILANVVAIPDATQTPEQIVGLAIGLEQNQQFARRLAENDCRVLVPVLIDRGDDFSSNPAIKRQTNLPHREFVHRMAYEMGRTLTGYEIQKVLSAVDCFCREKDHAPIGVVGYGDGGRLAFLSGAIDTRIRSTVVSGYFGPREQMWDEPIDRNVWGYLREFGDAELTAFFAQRSLVVEHAQQPKVEGPPPPRPGRAGAAPGRLVTPTEEVAKKEWDRAKDFHYLADAGYRSGYGLWHGTDGYIGTISMQERFQPDKVTIKPSGTAPAPLHNPIDAAARQKRQFDQLVTYTQKLWRDSDATRRDYWKNADATSTESWEKTTQSYRDYFHEEVIGKLPEPTMLLNPRTRQMYDEPKWTGYEVMLDVYPDVCAYGVLLLPKDLKPGEKRRVVVCQHGLEGRSTDITNPKETTRFYRSFGARLADLGYIVYAPQNPYIGQNHFRQIQRKAQPLKLSLFSFIVRQHQRTIDWLETLPNVDAKRIGFYGISYGGKTAMRVPAIEKRYALSICCADFNEWIGKNVSVDFPGSYLWTNEYDMYEFDLGNKFNYAEMAYLIAPRPFMVERGHDDNVGIDEMVAWEYAKVRYLYANKLKIPERTAIEFSPGGHQIFLKGTLAFLEKHLGKP